MNTIINGIDVQSEIPAGFFNIPEDWLVQKDDKICMVSKHKSDQQDKSHKTSWISPDENEIGKIKKFSGRVVIRRVLAGSVST